MKTLKILKRKEEHKFKRLGKLDSHTKYLLKRIVFTNLISIAIVIATYFWMIFFLSNVNTFWDLFRRKEIYVAQDTTAPVPPFLEPIPEATQSANIDITGASESGVKINLYIDNIKISDTISDSEGKFSFTNIPVGVFDEKIYVTAEDDSKNVSKKSPEYSIRKDTQAPEVDVTKPERDEVFKSTGHSYTVKGKTEPDSTVLVNNQLAIINPEGEFTASLRLNEGYNNIEVVVKDKAQNETKVDIPMKFEKID